MVTLRTSIGTQESARRWRVEPKGSITQTNIQKALEQIAAEPTAVTVTSRAAATYTALPTDTYIRVNFAGAVTITLGAASARNGVPLTIVDASGAASTNNITINRAGSDTIAGATSLQILADYGGWNLVPITGGYDVRP